MVLALAIVGTVLLAVSVWASRRNRTLPIERANPKLRVFWRYRWAIGIALGVASLFIHYPLHGGNDIYSVFGVPFMSYAFDQNGRDFVGVLTLPAIVLNFVTWTYAPNIVFFLLTLRSRYTPQEPSV